ncbi:MAG: hypothetical protein LBM96_08870 [Methanobrevibacter sp.]|jgi:superfamily II DNA/RNA helicase|nr:hypothetical protein [Candidatus Methanoflexus mossambicus]
MLYKICRGKRVILVSATPFNNEPSDILAQLKLFQNSHDSTLPNPKTRDLESYFGNIDSRLKRVKGDKEEYLAEIVKTSSEIRDDILRYLMVRRTRTGILKHYKKDLEKQGLKFPDVNNPQSVVYELDGKLDTIFNETLDLILNEFKYSRYTPLLYLKDFSKYDNPQRIITPQKNMFRFMKTLLFKRLESSFYAFKESINRFIYSYEHFIKLYNAGTVYISKKKINKIYQYFDEDNFEKIDDLVNNGSAETYNASDFNEEFIENLKHDLEILNKIKTLWNDVDSDPKLDKFIEILKGDTNLKEKLIVFTEAEDTMNYLTNHLNSEFDNKVLGFSGSSSMEDKHLVINNFDGKASKKSDDYRILISTDVLSQGMNLHQSNVVINYDIPWNPTKMMQRVGRVQRLDSEFNEVFIYNFFPASHISENLSLEEAAKSKLEAFIEMLGADSKLLLDEEIKTHELFTKLNSKSIFDDDTDDDSELEYLTLMRDIRDNDKELYDKIKAIPKKARTAKKIKNSLIKNDVGLFTFFRKGGLMKMYLNTLDNVLDIDFETATQILKANPDTKREDIGKNFYKLLNKNKNEFNKFFSVENEPKTKRNRNEVKLKKCLMALKNYSKFTDLEYNKINSYIEEVNKGSIPKKTLNKIFNELNNIKTNEKNEFSIFHTIRDIIDETLFDLNIETNSSVKTKDNHKPKEIILSEYLIKS